MEFYLSGRYDEQTKRLHAVTLSKDNTGKEIVSKNSFTGAKPEAEASVIGIVVKRALEQGCGNISIHTDFKAAIKMLSDGYKPMFQRSKDFIKYINKVKQNVSFEIDDKISEEMMSRLQALQNAREGNQMTEEHTDARNPFKKEAKPANRQFSTSWRTQPTQKQSEPVPSVSKPKQEAAAREFRVVVHDKDGKLLCDVNQDDFGRNNLRDAIFFADWYEQEAKDEKSYFYGVTVQRYGVPRTSELMQSIKPVEKAPDPPKEIKKEPEMEQMKLW